MQSITHYDVIAVITAASVVAAFRKSNNKPGINLHFKYAKVKTSPKGIIIRVQLSCNNSDVIQKKKFPACDHDTETKIVLHTQVVVDAVIASCLIMK